MRGMTVISNYKLRIINYELESVHKFYNIPIAVIPACPESFGNTDSGQAGMT